MSLGVLADKALIVFLKVLAEVNRDQQVLAYYCIDEHLVGKEGIFRLQMGVGLNAGWVIEEAVGSLQEVDASTWQRGWRLLRDSLVLQSWWHNSFFELMSSEAQTNNHKLELDVVTVKGSDVPMPIYMYDSLQTQTSPLSQYHNSAIWTIPKSEALPQQAE